MRLVDVLLAFPGILIAIGLVILASAAFAPGIAIALAVLGFNLLGDGLRDVLDPSVGR